MAGHEQQILHFITPRSASTVTLAKKIPEGTSFGIPFCVFWNRTPCRQILSSVLRFSVLSLTGFGDFVTNSSMIA